MRAKKPQGLPRIEEAAVSKPTYRPNCQARRCFNNRTGEVATATQYVVIGDLTRYVCGSCAKKLAIEAGIDDDPQLGHKRVGRAATPPPRNRSCELYGRAA